MPVSRGRKKKKSNSKNVRHVNNRDKDSMEKKSNGDMSGLKMAEFGSFEELREPSIDALFRIKPNDLDSMGLAVFYTACAPISELNQCVVASTILMMARKMLGASSEVVPAVVSFPWANERWGTPDPELLPGNITNGHVVLVTDQGNVIDVTAGQFAELRRFRNGLPIFAGRDKSLWDELCSPEFLDTDLDRRVNCVVIIGDDRSKEVIYELYHPYRANKVVSVCVSENMQALSLYLSSFVSFFTWILANQILVGDRTNEIDAITNGFFANKIREQIGAPEPRVW